MVHNDWTSPHILQQLAHIWECSVRAFAGTWTLMYCMSLELDPLDINKALKNRRLHSYSIIFSCAYGVRRGNQFSIVLGTDVYLLFLSTVVDLVLVERFQSVILSAWRDIRWCLHWNSFWWRVPSIGCCLAAASVDPLVVAGCGFGRRIWILTACSVLSLIVTY